jgi:hypothetical protein
MSMLIPSSTGQVFLSTESLFRNDIPPVNEVEETHVFVPFVKELWQKITTSGTGKSLINAYAMLQFGISSPNTVPVALHGYITTQLINTPPDIVLLSGCKPRLYGMHQRTPNVWQYIAINKDMVDRWADSMSQFPNERKALAEEAILKMAIIHEVGHWHYTLVSLPIRSCFIETSRANHYRSECRAVYCRNDGSSFSTSF